MFFKKEKNQYQNTKVETYEVKIYVGGKVGYDGEIVSLTVVEDVCQEYVNKIGLCVTVTDTNYVYKNGREHGYIVGFINYPRFPEEKEAIKHKAIFLAIKLKEALRQIRVSIVCPDETIMIGDNQKLNELTSGIGVIK